MSMFHIVFFFPTKLQGRTGRTPLLGSPNPAGMSASPEDTILGKHHETKKVWGKVFGGSFCPVYMTLVTYSSLCQLQKLLSGGGKKNKNNNPLRQAIFSINDKQNNYGQTKLKATGKKIEA